MSVSAVARKYGIHLKQLFRWRKLMDEGALSAVKPGEDVVPSSEVKSLKKRVRELERLLGRKTMEVEILKEAMEIALEKNCCCESSCRRRTIPDDNHCGNPRSLPFESVRKEDKEYFLSYRHRNQTVLEKSGRYALCAVDSEDSR